MAFDDFCHGIDAATFSNHPGSGLQTISHASGYVQILHDDNSCFRAGLPRACRVQLLHTFGMQTAWFKARMKRLRVSQEDIGRVLNLDRSVVSRILDGRQELRLSQVLPLAEILDVSEFEVLSRADMWRGDRTPRSIRAAAVVTEVQAGNFIEQPAEPPQSSRSVIVDYPHETVFAMIVRGDSMDRIAPDGSIVVVDYDQRDLRDGDLAVFRNEQGEATFKRYRHRDSDAWLQPESNNPRHATIFPPAGSVIEAIGRVIDIRPEYEEEAA